MYPMRVTTHHDRGEDQRDLQWADTMIFYGKQVQQEQ